MNKDIAIIGVAGRFPLADDLDELFRNLKEGKDCVGDLPRERVAATALPPGGSYRKCGYLKDIDKFDHKLFGLPLAEANYMCPEQRILLEVVYAALENSGYAPNYFSGTDTAVFVSRSYSEYHEHASEFIPTLITGNSPEYLAAKIGRQFNLKGNATSIDSSCASSLVALHSACAEINGGDARMAIVAGVNLMLFPFAGKGAGLDLDSPDGRSKAFSAQANGMSHGEAAAAVLLKPLDEAIRDCDIIHAVIKGTAVNNNGSASSSITAPDSRSQANVIRRAWKKAGVEPADLSFIEAHGSGTQLGDSLEFEGLNLAFSESRGGEKNGANRLCAMSTIKSNIGHARGAAGLSGLLKTVLSLKKKVLFPTIHFDEPNPLLDFKNAHVYINTSFIPWETEENKSRLAGITSLGANGANCHVVLQEGFTPSGKKEDPGPARTFHFPVSGMTAKALRQNSLALLDHISRNADLTLEDISYTLATGRNHYAFRESHVVSSMAELKRALSARSTTVREAPSPLTGKLIFVFSDSGVLPERLTDECKEQYAVFRNAWEECEKTGALADPTAKDLAFQYCFYQLLESVGISTDHFLPLGLGNILQRVINREISLTEGFRSVTEYRKERPDDLQRRIERLINNLSGEGNITFLDLAVQGTLFDLLVRYDDVNAPVYYISVDSKGRGPGRQDPLPGIIDVLYQRRFGNTPRYPFTYNLTGRKIELPSYRFEKIRCWLADAPKAGASHAADSPGKKCHIKEPVGSREETIGGIFAELLDLRELSIHDDFFELGGDSLKASKVILKINSLYRVSLDFEDVFDFPTVSLLAEFLNKQVSTEQKIMSIWHSVLREENLRPEDDFFELGGHSLLATTMIVLLNKEFDIRLDFEDVFRHSTIRELSRLVDSKKQKGGVVSGRYRIQPAARRESYALTHAQKRMWFLNYFTGGSHAYNNVLAVRLDGSLDYAVFDKAMLALLERHESLRTSFRLVGDEPRQFILRLEDIRFSVAFVDAKDPKRVDELIGEMVRQEIDHAYDLSVFPLFRVVLIRVEAQRHICILNKHHIISDGWSLGIFIEDFYQYYERISKGMPIDKEQPAIQIKDYAEWQQTEEFRRILDEQESYWLGEFKEPAPLLSLPIRGERPSIQSFEGDSLLFTLDRQTTERLKRIAADKGATLFMVLLAAYNIFLSKLSGAEDITVGTPVAGRRFDGLQELIGLFVNTIVLRNAPSSALSFNDFLLNVKQNSLRAFNHQDYPYEELVKRILTDRDPGRNPLFDAMFILQNNKGAAEAFGSISVAPYPIQARTARVDLVMEVVETEGELTVQFEYPIALFARDTMERFAGYFRNLIGGIIADADRRLGELDILPIEEKRRITHEFNGKTAEFAKDKTIPALFEQTALTRGEAIALSFEGRDLSYRELHERSDQLAARILAVCDGEERIVGILLNRSAETIISMLAVLKAGYAYLPIDVDHPIDRIGYIVGDSELDLLLTEPATAEICRQLSGDIRTLDVTAALAPVAPKGKIDLRFPSSRLAYLIYTSGSTGRPKGVMIEHRSVINFIDGITARVPIGEGTSVLCLTTASFDIFVLETMLPLLKGGRVILANSTEQKDPLALGRLILARGADCMQITPSHLKLLLAAGNSREVLAALRMVLVGGEAFSKELLTELQRMYSGKIYNMYGPTETTVWSTMQELTEAKTVNIGNPIANTTIRILDGNLQILPVGVAGELFIGGEGLARGYWKKKTLTEERFIPDPYCDNARIYRTGDLARWLPDGSIDYLGRMDNQVKIRGFRIEPGEIESRLRAHEQIRDAVVVTRQKGGDTFLVAYYVADAEIPAKDLKEFLAVQLPAYMIPAFFVLMNSIPLTPNGKINTGALPEPQVKKGADRHLPSGATENKLALIWAEVLHLEKDKIGLHDDFFALGGHSIMAVRLIYAIQHHFSVEITLRTIFEHATIHRQSRWIDQAAGRYSPVIARVEKKEFYPASPAQEGLFYEQLLNKDNLSYNISGAYKINGPLDTGRLKETFQLLINRHESLRTSFAVIEDVIVQCPHERADIEFVVSNAERYETVEKAFRSFVQPFDLSAPSLMRCGLWSHPEHGHLLFVDIHHIVCDGVSLNILMNDFNALYEGRVLSPLELRYADYAHWQRRPNGELDRQKAFWLRKLSGELPRIDLPVVRERAAAGAFRVSEKVLELDAGVTRQVRQLTAEANVSPFMFLLSLYYILLHKVTGASDIIIGTDAIGRTQASFKNIVGTFINVLPLRMEISDSMSFADLLRAVKDCVLEAFDNQDYQFDRILAQLNKERGEKVVDVHFSFSNYLDKPAGTGELKISEFRMDRLNRMAQYEFNLDAQEAGDRQLISFIYSHELYEQDTIELLMNYYYRILTAVLRNGDVLIADIELEDQLVQDGINSIG